MDAAKRACSSSDSPNFRCVASPAMTRTRQSKVFESAFSSSRARAVPAMEPSRTRQNNAASGAIRAKISRIRHRPRSPVAPVRKTPLARPSDGTVFDGASLFTTSSLPDASRRFQTPAFIRTFMRFIRADAGSGSTGSTCKALFAHTSPFSIAATVAIALATASAGVHHSLHRSPIRMSEVHPPAMVANASAIVPSPSHPRPSSERGPMFPGRYTQTGTPHDSAVAHTSISVTHLACAYPCHVPPCTSAVSYPPFAASDASAFPLPVADSDQDSSEEVAGVPSGGRTALDDT
mmetsp:Transcript_5429/g.20391  ORF Transcript_5429/g.20391 Transcript_5429/m.20391 type:complete len:292 (+) Transcript_5429:700-1575(+)